ncbi:MAG: Gldg family protein, partial [Thermoanaerobaculia bacterium]|nr:Gldg family protein [Thermoanaerobaculia bacterium]
MSGVRDDRARRLAASSSLGAGVLLVAALLGLVNYFGWKYHRRLDWTASEIYSLSDKTKNVLAQLDRDVRAVVFLVPGSPLYHAVTELLGRYDAGSPRFSVRLIDAERNPAEAKQLIDAYEVAALDTVIFEAGDDRRAINEADLALWDYSGMELG